MLTASHDYLAVLMLHEINDYILIRRMKSKVSITHSANCDLIWMIKMQNKPPQATCKLYALRVFRYCSAGIRSKRRWLRNLRELSPSSCDCIIGLGRLVNKSLKGRALFADSNIATRFWKPSHFGGPWKHGES